MSGRKVCLSFAGRGITEIPAIAKGTRLLKLNVSNNPIRDLSGMLPYRSLKSFLADNTKLVSLKGAAPQRHMKQISAKKTPLGSLRFFPLMALIAFGDDLTVVNDQTVSAGLIDRARRLRPFVADFLLEGWVIMSLNPITLLDPVTRRRRRLYTPVNARALQDSGEVVVLRDNSSDSDNSTPEPAPESPTQQESEDDEAELRARFDSFQRHVEASMPRRQGSPVRCLSRQSKGTLRNSLRDPVSPEKRNVSPVRPGPKFQRMQ